MIPKHFNQKFFSILSSVSFKQNIDIHQFLSFLERNDKIELSITLSALK